MLIEVITQDLCKSRLSCSRLTYNDGIHGDTDFCDILTRTQICISIHYGLELTFHFVKTNQFIKHIQRGHRLTTPFTELGYAPVFLMTILTDHLFYISL